MLLFGIVIVVVVTVIQSRNYNYSDMKCIWEPINATDETLYQPMNDGRYSNWCYVKLPSHYDSSPNVPAQCYTNITINLPPNIKSVQVTGSPPSYVLPCYQPDTNNAKNTNKTNKTSSSNDGVCWAQFKKVYKENNQLTISLVWTAESWNLYFGFQECVFVDNSDTTMLSRKMQKLPSLPHCNFSSNTGLNIKPDCVW